MASTSRTPESESNLWDKLKEVPLWEEIKDFGRFCLISPFNPYGELSRAERKTRTEVLLQAIRAAAPEADIAAIRQHLPPANLQTRAFGVLADELEALEMAGTVRIEKHTLNGRTRFFYHVTDDAEQTPAPVAAAQTSAAA